MTGSSPFERLKAIALAGQVLSIFGGAAVAVFSLGRWLDGPTLAASLVAELPTAPVPQGSVLLTAYVISLVPAAIFVGAMAEAWRLFGLLGRGKPFTAPVPRSLARLAYWATAAAGAGLVMRTVLGLVLTASAPGGRKQLIIAIGSDEIGVLVMALLLLAFALVMREAIRLDEDNQGII
ncbi:MAG: DUF2975 domain-containing protein [Devosia sp.]|nr:DUF2975 domain-containing protein [Devosia sp.]